MPYVRVYVEPDEVLEEIDDDDLKKELARRKLPGVDVSDPSEDRLLLEQAYEQLRGREDVPAQLREYVWRVLGRVL
jgi:hypothetical protein